jgi:hypothetical protein
MMSFEIILCFFIFGQRKKRKRRKSSVLKYLRERKHFFGASQELKAAYKIKEDGVPVSRG